MAANPLVDQGSLNRVRGSVVIPNFSSLNVTAAFLGKQAISLGLQGSAVTYIPTQTGAVTSPEPYMMVNCRVALLKTQALAGAYKSQMELDARIGNYTVIPDASTLPNYSIVNGSIADIGEMSFAGEDPVYLVTLMGYYCVNSNLWNLL